LNRINAFSSVFGGEADVCMLALFYSFVANDTVTGRHIRAVGGNKHAAKLSGVKSRRIDFLVMMNMSVLAALAGMIFVGCGSRGPSFFCRQDRLGRFIGTHQSCPYGSRVTSQGAWNDVDICARRDMDPAADFGFEGGN
jgi:hypothetical protein